MNLRFGAAVAAAGLLLTIGCAKKAPPAPESLKAALARAEQDVGVAPVPQAKAACDALLSELNAYAASTPEPARPPISRVARELTELRDQRLRVVSTREEWEALRARIQAVVEGRDPGPGPRFRMDLPKPVQDAIGEAEEALAARDLTSACAAIDRATMALSDYRWVNPPPPNVGTLEQALGELDALPDSCRAHGIAEAKEKFEAAVALLERKDR